MSSLLTTLRQKTPPLRPRDFLASHPGCWVHYSDDTPAKDPRKALSMRTFHPWLARKKQGERCGVCFSLQAFTGPRTKERIASFRNLGVDVDLIRGPLSPEESDRRKEEYLRRRLLPFPLKPHWLIETRCGFHVLFRIRPLFLPEAIRAAEAANRRLVRLLQGDDRACLLPQALRVPGTFQWDDPRHPFFCRLLLDNARTIVPYDLEVVRSTLDAIEEWDLRAPSPLPEREPRSVYQGIVWGERRSRERGGRAAGIQYPDDLRAEVIIRIHRGGAEGARRIEFREAPSGGRGQPERRQEEPPVTDSQL